METRRTADPQTRRTPDLRILVIAAAVAVAFGLRNPALAADPASAQTRTAPAPTNLPVVATPPTGQPAVGLATDTHLDKTPPRKTAGLDLVRSGWTYNCMECHKLFAAKWHYDRPLNEHKHIQLRHGENRFCLNCHHPTNRNAFVDYDGAEIAQADVVSLCAKCHGTIYRDWKAGVHGRQNGYWNATLGEKTKLRCIQCHDPHTPKFQPIQPLAPLKYPPRGANVPDKHKNTAHGTTARGLGAAPAHR